MNRLQKNYRQKQEMLWWYIVSLVFLSLSLIFMPIVSELKSSTKIPMLANGALFWLSLIFTVCAAIRINSSRQKCADFNEKYKKLKKLGLVHFFQNKQAIVIDVIMFFSLTASVLSQIYVWKLIIQFLFVSIFVFSFGMHCMLNGINYIYIKHKTKVRRC